MTRTGSITIPVHTLHRVGSPTGTPNSPPSRHGHHAATSAKPPNPMV